MIASLSCSSGSVGEVVSGDFLEVYLVLPAELLQAFGIDFGIDIGALFGLHCIEDLLEIVLSSSLG